MTAEKPETAAPDNPFVGLRPFESHESVLFFGREEQTVALLECLHREGFVAVVGSSGSGKSSLVRAGLIPKLEGGFLAGDRDRWHVAIMKPGQDPLANLEAAIASVTGERPAALADAGTRGVVDAVAPHLADGDANLLLVVDQFEELFRFGVRSAEGTRHEAAADFVALLLELVKQRELPVYVVLTMRSDFLGDCDLFQGLPEALNRSQYLVPRLTRQQLRASIVGPIGLFGAAVSEPLVNRVLNDAGAERDSLPVVQHALMRTWQMWRREGEGEVGPSHYEAAGTAERALSEHAEEALDGMSSEELATTELVFRALTDIDQSNRRIRRPARLSELEAVTGVGREEILGLIGRFRSGGRSFLVLSDDADDPLVDISHESLIRQWDNLRGWVDTEAEAGETYERLAGAARRCRRGEGAFLTGRDLEVALQWRQNTAPEAAWARRYGGGLSETMEFLAESQRRHEEEVAAKQRLHEELEAARERERRALEEKVTLSERHAEQLQQKQQLANYLLAQVFEEKAYGHLKQARQDSSQRGFRKAWLYSLAALAEDVGRRSLPLSVGRILTPDLRVGAFGRVWRSPSPPGSIRSVAFSPDGRRFAAACDDRTVRLWDAETGEALAILEEHSDPVWTVTFSADGRRLASGSEDQTVRLWDVETGTSLATLQGHTDQVWSVAFSPDGRRLASGCDDRTIRLWDVETGAPMAMLEGHTAAVWGVAFDPGGTHLASASDDRTVRLWDVETGACLTTLEGHSKRVRSVAFSSDGRRLASGSEDRTIRLWEVGAGAPPTILEGHAAPVWGIDFSGDGRRLASGSEDRTVRVWDVEAGAGLAVLEGHSAPVWSVAFHPDGRRLVSGSDDQTARLWEVESGADLATLEGHSQKVSTLAFAPDGRRLASGSGDRRIHLWDVGTGACLATFEGHSEEVTSLAFSPDGRSLASGSLDLTIRLWDAETGEPLATLEGLVEAATALAFSLEGRLASGSPKEVARLWNLATGDSRPLRDRSADGPPVRSLAFSPDGSFLATGHEDGSIRIRDIEADVDRPLLEKLSGPVSSLAFSPDGQRLVSGTEGVGDTSVQSMRIWNVRTGEPLEAFGLWTAVEHVAFDGKRVACSSSDGTSRGWKAEIWSPEANESSAILAGRSAPIRKVAFSPDGRRLASTSDDQGLRLWDLGACQAATALAGHRDLVRCVAFSPDGGLLVSGSDDQTVRLWDVETGGRPRILKGHSDPIRSVAFSPDGRLLASGSKEGTIRFWDVETADRVRSLEEPSAGLLGVAFSPDGRRLASGSTDGSVRLWDVEDGDLVATLEGHSEQVSSVAFSPLGMLLASGSSDRTVRLWDVASGELQAALEGHWDRVWSVAFSPGGRLLATGSYDRTVRLWDVASGRALAALEGHSGPVRSVAFSRDGRYLASGSDDGTVRSWVVETGEALAILEGHSDRVWSVAFSPDGRRLASGSFDGTLRFWYSPRLAALASPETRRPALASIYRASLDWTGLRREELRFRPRSDRIALSPVNGYTFPQPPPARRMLHRPRPPGKDVLEWLLENADGADD